MIGIIKTLQKNLPDDLTNVVLSFTGNVTENPEVIYYNISIINPEKSYTYYDIITKEYVTIDEENDYFFIYNCPGRSICICECGKVVRIFNIHHHIHQYNKIITINQIKDILKKELQFVNKTRIQSRLRIYERGNQRNTLMTIFNINEVEIEINKHKYSPETLE